MADLSFVGLGLMGSRIVQRLQDAGHQVTGCHRTRAEAEALLRIGMQRGNMPRKVAEAADITFRMVSDTAALSFVANGQDAVLAQLSGISEE